MIRLHPYSITFLSGFSIIIVLLYNNIKLNLLILSYWILINIFFKNIKSVINLILAFLPLYIFMIFIWGILNIGHSGNGFVFASNKMLILLNLSLSMRFFFDTALRDSKDFYSQIGFKNETLLMLCGVSSSFIEVKRRTNQLIVARYSRGKLKKRNLFYTIIQIPYIIRPLVISTIETAIIRANSLNQKEVLKGPYFATIKRKKAHAIDLIFIFLFLLIILTCLFYGWH